MSDPITNITWAIFALVGLVLAMCWLRRENARAKLEGTFKTTPEEQERREKELQNPGQSPFFARGAKKLYQRKVADRCRSF